jgi:hypothetical protein
MKGDRLVAGSDASAGLICFKRDREYGFTLAGGSLTENKAKSHLVANVQVSVSEDSPLWQLMKDKLGRWFALTPQGLLMVASVLPVDTTTT